MATEVTIRDSSAPLEATFMPELGMVGSSLRHEGEELFAQQGGPDAYAANGSTFGLPLLYPWANRLSAWEYGSGSALIRLDPDSPILHRDTQTGLPIHGMLAASGHWHLTDTGTGHLTAEMDFGGVPEYMEAFPFPHRLQYDARFSHGALVVSVTVTPTSELPVPIAFGLHPYLTLPGSDRRDWEISLPVTREVVLDDEMIPTREFNRLVPQELNGPLAWRTFDTSFDQLDDSAGPPVFSVADANRRIAVEFRRGYRVAQVYAPDESQFICFEPMTAPVNALRSGDRLGWAQAEPFTAEFAITVS